MTDTPSTPLRISEIYRTIQGESSRAGWPCTIVRLAGCAVGCAWCDSEAASEGGEPMTIEAVLDRVDALGCPLVEVTGGEPLEQAACADLLRALCDGGCRVLLETGGVADVSVVDPRVVKIVDVKCPGSGCDDAMDWANLDRLAPDDELKFVLADRADYEWARRTLETRLAGCAHTIHFSPVHGRLDPAVLAGWLLDDGLRVRLNLQLHKYIWPGRCSGV